MVTEPQAEETVNIKTGRWEQAQLLQEQETVSGPGEEKEMSERQQEHMKH